ncbi:response regulator [Shinella sp. AETb1-6]|uniref:response regulator n=1 Tax=Shinella TaxID=323620 RepID=UPI001368122E|nr:MULTISPECIES: response regulator [Shinella]MXN53580.1 response regulator [Shinella sp. AETb1-6]UPA26030.1 response regulator [Shinella oryzae]WLS08254.1 response regulator [Shinella sumterensis]
MIVVDDDPVDVRFVLRAFSDAGSTLDITHVSDAKAASDRLDAEVFDYILLDINMPGTSGVDLLKRLRSQPRTAVTPVIMLSSSSSMTDINRAYESGANAYAVKPSTLSGYREFAEGFTRFWVDVAVSP